jgi:hypothetical protein
MPGCSTVTWRLKAGIVKSADMSIAKQRLAKHVPERYENTRLFLGSGFGCRGITSVPGTTHSWTQKWNHLRRWSIFGLREVSSVRDSGSQGEFEKESYRGLRIKDGLVSRCWRINFVCYSYSNPQSVRITCTYDLWVSNKLIRQSEPRLQVTNTRDSTAPLFSVVGSYSGDVFYSDA